MAKKYLGIDIGSYNLKIAVCTGKVLNRYVTVPIPDNLVREGRIVSYNAMADLIKETIKAHKIRKYDVVCVLPMETYFIKRSKFPLMTAQQLSINIPYEMHDYITDESSAYVYDYAVIEANEEGMDLMIAATSKEVVDSYGAMMKRAGLKLVKLVPDVLALQAIVMPPLDEKAFKQQQKAQKQLDDQFRKEEMRAAKEAEKAEKEAAKQATKDAQRAVREAAQASAAGASAQAQLDYEPLEKENTIPTYEAPAQSSSISEIPRYEIPASADRTADAIVSSFMSAQPSESSADTNDPSEPDRSYGRSSLLFGGDADSDHTTDVADSNIKSDSSTSNEPLQDVAAEADTKSSDSESGTAARPAEASVLEPSDAKDFVVFDIGHNGTRLHFFSHDSYEITRELNTGARQIVEIVAEEQNIHPHIAQIKVEHNQDNVLGNQRIEDVLDELTTEVMRVMNFYNYNNPNNTIDRMYYFGNGIDPDGLLSRIEEAIGLPVVPLTALVSARKIDGTEEFICGPQAYGAVIE